MPTNRNVPRDELSETMAAAVLAIADDPDHSTRPEGGGYWQASGKRADFTTKTVYALNDRGIIERQYKARDPHRDTYKLSAKGHGVAGKLRAAQVQP